MKKKYLVCVSSLVSLELRARGTDEAWGIFFLGPTLVTLAAFSLRMGHVLSFASERAPESLLVLGVCIRLLSVSLRSRIRGWHMAVVAAKSSVGRTYTRSGNVREW